MQLQFFNPYVEVKQTENRLPHWQQHGAVYAVYFVTFRLGDANPIKLQRDWQAEREIWLTVNPQPWTQDVEREYHARFSAQIEQWLDAGHGSCVLRRRDCGKIMDKALHHFDGSRLSLISSIVMPNHVHALFVQNPEYSLEKLLRSWKSFPSRQINVLLGRAGALWQVDYFDRLVRDEGHFANCVRYIRRNPLKARLRTGEYILYESDTASRIE